MNRKYDDDDSPRRHNKAVKHSRNIPGQGMRVINSYYEDDDSYFDDDLEVEDSIHITHTTHTLR